MIQHGIWFFPFAIQTKLELVYSGHVFFKAKVRRNEPHLLDDYCDCPKQFYFRVVKLQYSRNLYIIHIVGIFFN